MTDPQTPRLSVTFTPDGCPTIDALMTGRQAMRVVALLTDGIDDPGCQCPGCRTLRLVHAAAVNFEALCARDDAPAAAASAEGRPH